MLSCISRVQLCATPWTVAHQAPLSMELSRQECWSGLPIPSPIFIYNVILFISEKEDILPFATIWMKMEDTILSDLAKYRVTTIA